MKLVKKSVVVFGVLSLVLTLSPLESFAKPFVKKVSKKVEKTDTITSKKDLTKKFNRNLLKLKGKFTFKISTSVVKNRKALLKVLDAGVKKDAGATVVYKFAKNKKPSVKKIGKFLLVKFNMKYDKKRISKALALAYAKGFLTTKVTRWNEGITKAEGIDLIIKALGEFSNTGIVKNGLEVVEEVTEETEENTGGDMAGLVVTEEENDADPYARYKKQINLDKEEVEKGLGEKAENISIEELNTTMIVVKAANVREGAGTSYNAPTFIERGQEIKVTGKTSNSWYRISLPEYGLENVFVPVVSLTEKEGTENTKDTKTEEKAEKQAENEDKKVEQKDKKVEQKDKKVEPNQKGVTPKKVEQTKKAETVKKDSQVKKDTQVKKDAQIKKVEQTKKVEPAKKVTKKQENKKVEQKKKIGDGKFTGWTTDIYGNKIEVVDDGSAFNTNTDDIEE